MYQTGKIFLVLIIQFAILGINQSFCQTAKNPFIVELAPLKGVLGQFSGRMETDVAKNFGYSIAYEDINQEGKRDDLQDRFQSIANEIIWYYQPASNKTGLFICGGVTLEHALIGDKKERSILTWSRTYADDMHDRWTNEEMNFLTTQSIGYRYSYNEFLTSSLRFQLQEKLLSSSRTIHKDIHSQDVDTSQTASPNMRRSLLLLVGVMF